LAFPKQMHWDAMLEDGRGELVFGRPIRWLLYLYGGRVVPFTIGRVPGAAGSLVQEITTGAVTYGHRFLATSGRAGRSIKVRTFDEYRARLPEHFVILDHTERRDRIARELEAKARKLGGRVHLREHAALLAEVADLVEYPGVVAGFFERDFLELPQEVLTTTLVHHQHYFPVLSEKGELKEAFLAIVNTQPSDERTIARNTERVVTARLRDARFFWESDRKTRLEDRLERLHSLVFHKKLQGNSYRDKAERIEGLARRIAGEVFGAADAADHAARAAKLAKADLVTDMVFEFPELQGVMGGIYAREQGEPEQVWKAIYSHYLPIGVEADAPPSRAQLGAAAVTWAAVSLADKLDTFTSLTRIGEKATGSRDPFGLRRQMQGIVRTLMDLPELTGIDREISLLDLFRLAADGSNEWSAASGLNEALQFANERLRYILEYRRVPQDVVRAATSHEQYVIPLMARRVAAALQAVRTSENFQRLAELFKRVKNISKDVTIEMSWEELAAYGAGSSDTPEQALITQAARSAKLVEQAQKELRYDDALMRLAELQPHVAKFFDEVMVMAEEPTKRRARLQLMAKLRDLVLQIADISEIVTEGASRT
ncbi:MAG TPA: glycine--tRNA ligase subunit beta, partial [Vicinamibacterales bacterium]|nr:glycine--tRNA ligase subunit beta [Vicinamibacterales bacterium]